MIQRQFVLDNEDIEIIAQSREMAEDQKEDFLNRFKTSVTGTLVGFAVMGGIFGEGIDLKGDHLTGAAIVGVGLPGISIERDLIREYFEAIQQSGF